jgi:hypothetical protein
VDIEWTLPFACECDSGGCEDVVLPTLADATRSLL